MDNVLLGLIYLVVPIAIVAVIYRMVTDSGRSGKGAVETIKRAAGGTMEGLAIQNAPVQSHWRGLPLPVAADQLRHKNENVVAYFLPGSRIAVASQWFENNWTREGYSLVNRATEPLAAEGPRRGYEFQRQGETGTILVVFQLVPPQFSGAKPVTAVVISDER
jgi:hypothetical protein